MVRRGRTRRNRTSFARSGLEFAKEKRREEKTEGCTGGSVPDPAHSASGEERFVNIGMSTKTVCCLWFIRKQTVLSISAPGSLLQPKENSRKNPETSSAAAMPTAVRGKYANLLQQGTNVAILDPDIVEHFPDSESVNNALRAFRAIGKEVESASIHILRKAPRAVSSKRNVTFDPRKGSTLKTRAAAK